MRKKLKESNTATTLIASNVPRALSATELEIVASGSIVNGANVVEVPTPTPEPIGPS
jgi:hypothetical protein